MSNFKFVAYNRQTKIREWSVRGKVDFQIKYTFHYR